MPLRIYMAREIPRRQFSFNAPRGPLGRDIVRNLTSSLTSLGRKGQSARLCTALTNAHFEAFAEDLRRSPVVPAFIASERLE